jgi:hypothetical protein
VACADPAATGILVARLDALAEKEKCSGAVPTPGMGAPDKGLASIGSAPGAYVHQI